MQIKVVTSDIRASIPNGLHNPIAIALARATGRKWFVWAGNVAREMETPYRDVPLTGEVASSFSDYLHTGTMQPFEFEFNEPG